MSHISAKITILEAKNTVSHKGEGIDSYFKLKANFLAVALKTRTAEKSSTPKYNETFTIEVPDSQKKGVSRTIVLIGYKPKRFSDKVLGEVEINLEKNEDVDGWFELKKKKEDKKGKVSVHVIVKFAGQKEAKKEETFEEFPDRSEFDKKYTKENEIGQGAFSVVYKGIRKEDGVSVAVKQVNKTSQSSDQLKLLRREIDVMRKLSNHPNVVKLYDVYEDEKTILMVIEYMSGGELYDQIIQRGSFTEADASDIVYQILSALCYIHSNGIGHRDLKPENLLCATPKGDIVKIADFGLSKDNSDGNTAMTTCCGSPSYVAPEVLEGSSYDHECDIWSLGVITYVLLSGYLPFFGETQDELFQKIMSGDYTFNYSCFKGVSEEAKDFINKCLVVDPQERATAAQLMEHPWVHPENRNLPSMKSAALHPTASMNELSSGFNPKNRQNPGA
ncbi:protein kinase, putative [Entamoeba histolytica HM-1:IMSS-B]|uniref:Protein kinase, putative n=6 Tax=Entamoeba histolytica TaxID=5759 RepID=C4M3C4_ENTH1|nr:protein kinase, putative [Entamoeba histolytica HM-1:IMSS]EMD49748.1 protein kinase, putative [Entamoeba histolytica KU27]EMH74738.1 protein kinase, putative [Entamoeba histolytica HM-1:IMSS-B]EMS15143.1 protein kinase, putative [Entamoeba histolytica HM-3:IMSS]ENY62908.1 protein kinase, putative [Entamoeba histolytica HM-1:IMSS-A]GAT95809.1 protein kinase putative [Entamoeba histolytica]|eukprot:XP_657095.1 protein kinase, putative [Entamoeba histolytica HM-1:IMSS]